MLNQQMQQKKYLRTIFHWNSFNCELKFYGMQLSALTLARLYVCNEKELLILRLLLRLHVTTFYWF